MPEQFGDRLKHAWNAFMNRDPPEEEYKYPGYGASNSYRPDRPKISFRNEKTIVNAIFNRIAVDCASADILHARLDPNGRFIEEMDSGLNYCLRQEANIDQTGRAFILDAVITMLDEGVVALVPVETNLNPKTSSFDILNMRVGKIVQWYPQHVRIDLYNEGTGLHEQITLPKKVVAIVENPFYSVMNEPNSTLQRLSRKLALLDVIDEQSSSGKLDLIIQLPYTIKSELRRRQAEERRKDIEQQLTNTKYGIAYTDGTEKITQLNRSVENNLLKQVEYLTDLLFSQLGITKEILSGMADEKTQLNYSNGIISVILTAFTDEMKRKFLTKTARTQRQSILFFKDPFKLVPISQIAEIADKFTRNEVLSSNEIRQIVGFKPVDDPRADELSNKNLNKPNAISTSPEQEQYEDENYPEVDQDRIQQYLNEIEARRQ